MGTMEGTNAHVGVARLKGQGHSWSRAGAEAMCLARCALATGARRSSRRTKGPSSHSGSARPRCEEERGAPARRRRRRGEDTCPRIRLAPFHEDGSRVPCEHLLEWRRRKGCGRFLYPGRPRLSRTLFGVNPGKLNSLGNRGRFCCSAGSGIMDEIFEREEDEWKTR